MHEVSNQSFLIGAFYACSEGEAPWVTGFAGDPYNVDRRLWGGKPLLQGLPWFIRPSHNNYVCISTFIPAADGSWHRRQKCFAGMHCVMVDDVGTKVDHDKITLTPSVIVETSPGNYQVWYFLTRPETDPMRADSLIKGMIANGLTADSSDPGMRGVTRYGRLPIGVNGKSKYVEKLGKPFVQRVTHWSPTTRYTLDQIAVAYGVDLDRDVSSKGGRRASLRSRQVQPLNASADLQLLVRASLYLEPVTGLTGAHRIVCPWVYEHTDEDPSGTVYFEPSEQNAWRAGFKCHHGHCAHRNFADLRYFLNRLQQITKE